MAIVLTILSLLVELVLPPTFIPILIFWAIVIPIWIAAKIASGIFG